MAKPGNKPGVCRVKVPHLSDFPNPLILRSGETLEVSDRESEWPGWIWCTNQQGTSGWAPGNYLTQHGDTWRANRDYDATELSVQIGEILKMREDESGWVWCTNQEGSSGWVPIENLEIISGEP